MGTQAKASTTKVDQFFTVAEARFDRWRQLLQVARKWENASSWQSSEKETQQAATAAAFPVSWPAART